jgi:molybdate/tungstate transport system substrate-binding protein
MFNRKVQVILFTLFIVLMLFFQTVSFTLAGDSLKGELVILHAGSLTVPVDNLKKEFNKINPDVEIKTVPGGSVALARMLTELGQKADIFMSADYMVINTLLIPKFADWNLLFAENAMVIMYTDKSKHADEINDQNWYEILAKEGVEYGYSNPDMDPCGYRSVLLFQLAENYYQKKGINQALLNHCPQKNIRPKSVELIALLETGALDYAFEYESVALQHQLMDKKFKYLKLPAAINLSSLNYVEDYAKATVEIAGTEPGKTTVVKGEPVVYGLTMPLNGENRENALAFMKFLLTPDQGLKVLLDSGQPVHPIEVVAGKEKIPQKLIELIP